MRLLLLSLRPRFEEFHDWHACNDADYERSISNAFNAYVFDEGNARWMSLYTLGLDYNFVITVVRVSGICTIFKPLSWMLIEHANYLPVFVKAIDMLCELQETRVIRDGFISCRARELSVWFASTDPYVLGSKKGNTTLLSQTFKL